MPCGWLCDACENGDSGVSETITRGGDVGGGEGWHGDVIAAGGDNEILGRGDEVCVMEIRGGEGVVLSNSTTRSWRLCNK